MTSRSVENIKNTELIVCACGCGETLYRYNRKYGYEMKYINGHGNKGIKMSEDWRTQLSKARIGKYRGEKSYQWKADNVSYSGLHHWLKKYLPKPESGLCQFCSQFPAKEIANLNGVYTRELENYAWFCVRCHRLFDNNYERNFKEYNESRRKDLTL
jgi:hypothetical protein